MTILLKEELILIPIRNMPTETRQPFCPVVAALLAGMFLIGISIIKQPLKQIKPTT